MTFSMERQSRDSYDLFVRRYLDTFRSTSVGSVHIATSPRPFTSCSTNQNTNTSLIGASIPTEVEQMASIAKMSFCLMPSIALIEAINTR
jgi:hypothetical protein